MLGITRKDIKDATADIRRGLFAWRLWSLYGFTDIKLRYRRSVLGPFWASLSMFVQVACMAFVFTFLFNTKLERFLPYLTIGMVLWSLLTAVVIEGANTFVASSDLILQVKRPLSVYIWQTIWRNLIIGAHMAVIFFVVALIFSIYPDWIYLAAVPGLCLFILNMAWMALFAAILSTRYRDLPMIVTNIFTVLFWLTPIIYEPHQATGVMQRIVVLNPFTHMLEIVRDPLLLSAPSARSWLVATGMSILGWAATALLYARTRKRIPFWL
jgi:ABC-type polysaccharide/polyol phosphate export permease